MTALSADAPLRIWGTPVTRKFILDTTAARTVYKGQPLLVDQDVDATGPVVPFIDITHPVVAATDVFMGIAAEGKAVVISATEDIPTAGIEAYIEPTIVGFKSTVFTDGVDAGLGVYMTDSGTLAKVASVADAAFIGKFMWASDGYDYVKLAVQICTGA